MPISWVRVSVVCSEGRRLFEEVDRHSGRGLVGLGLHWTRSSIPLPEGRTVGHERSSSIARISRWKVMEYFIAVL